MRTLVTGGTGFIGRRLLPHLKRPVVLSRFGSRRQGALASLDLTAYDWDSTSGPPPEQAFDNVDVVIHLAGENIGSGRWTRAKRRKIYASRVTGTSHLVSTLTRLTRAPRLLIAASAIGYYGDHGDEVLNESSPRGHDFLADLCVAWESAALAAADAGIRVVLLRTAPVLGPGGGVLAKMLLPFKFGVGGRLGNGRQWMPWIALDDWVRLVLFLCDRETIHGPVNATSPNPCTNAEFTAALGEVLHRPTWFTVPAPVLRLAVGPLANVLLASQRVIPEIAIDTGFQFQYPYVKAALA
ncbi:MAG: TIGR01777 family oxidoreductase, partial [Planctomycetota bacterium]